MAHSAVTSMCSWMQFDLKTFEVPNITQQPCPLSSFNPHMGFRALRVTGVEKLRAEQLFKALRCMMHVKGIVHPSKPLKG